MHYGASNLIFQKAEELRKFPTHEEEILWGYLSESQLGVKFRRQHPIFNYIADFYCHSIKLVIEIDGSIHDKEDVKINDERRQKEIESFGITVIRFTNNEVKNTPESVLQSINEEIKKIIESNTPSSPLGAGGHGGRRAMLLCAGYGTRLKPWTDKHPKALAIVNNKPLLQRNVEYLASFGITDIIINLHHFADQIRDAVKEANGWGTKISFSDETDAILETGGGLKRAASFFDTEESLVLMNVDILTDLDLHKMIDQHNKMKPLATLATTNRGTSRYFLFDEDDTLCGWRNTKTGEEKISRETKGLIQKAFSGIHIISPDIFSLMKQEGKFSMVDVYLDLAQTHTIKSFDHSDSKFIDVGKPESILKAEALFS